MFYACLCKVSDTVTTCVSPPSILLFPIMFMILLSPIADDSPGDDFIKRISVFLGPRLMHLSGEVRDFITRNRSQR